MRRMTVLAGLLALTVAAPTLAAADRWNDSRDDRGVFSLFDDRSERDLRRAYNQGRRDALREARRDDERRRRGRGGVRLYDHDGRRRLDWEENARNHGERWRDDRWREERWHDDRRRDRDARRRYGDRDRYGDRYRERDAFSPADIIIPLLTR